MISPNTLKDRKSSKPTFSHWSGRTLPSNAFKMRRATSEFTERTMLSSPSAADYSCLISGNIGIAHTLPCFDSPRDAIKRISRSTMAQVLSGDFAHLYKKAIIVDCRYPYEFHGGHLPNAINVCALDSIDKILFEDSSLEDSHSTVVIFHCEFSSERAPRMALHVRNFDRVLNASNYPNLNYPQLYILDGGYKNFFLQYPDRCDPPNQYVPMRNSGHRDELRHHQRLKFQDGQVNGKHRHKLRSCSLRKSHSIAMPHPVAAISSFLRNRDSAQTAFCPQAVDMLSSDIGDICDQGELILQEVEGFLCTPIQDGRISK
jgi:rhodanese-related sulfurtransferase